MHFHPPPPAPPIAGSLHPPPLLDSSTTPNSVVAWRRGDAPTAVLRRPPSAVAGPRPCAIGCSLDFPNSNNMLETFWDF
jgi:hypothetical protein